MINGATSAPPTNKGGANGTKCRKIHFGPRVLIAADDNARGVPVDQQEW